MTVTVTDAGLAVVGAKVLFGGVTVRTNSHGKAVVKVKKHASSEEAADRVPDVLRDEAPDR